MNTKLKHNHSLESYHEFHCSTNQVDVVGGEESVCQKATEKSKKERCAHEIGNDICRAGWSKMHEPWQVQHKVACIRQEC